MPPRFAYWTIIIDDAPTAFRAARIEDLLPTFQRLKSRHPSAVLKWFQSGRLWDSREEAREKLRAGYRPGPAGELIPPDEARRRGRDWRPGGAHRDPREPYRRAKKARWRRLKKALRDAARRGAGGSPPSGEAGGSPRPSGHRPARARDGGSSRRPAGPGRAARPRPKPRKG